MTQAEKELLLKDLCARLPYDIVCEMGPKNGNKIVEKLKLGGLDQLIIGNWEIKPYLFPMSSMTEEQESQYQWLQGHVLDCMRNSFYFDTLASLDYLYSNHIDVRGWIDKGMALDATGLNIY